MDRTNKKEKQESIPSPLHSIVSAALIRRIRSGKLRRGDRIPSERDLTEFFSVSRSTARHALQMLEKFGYIERQGTKGTFVRFDSVQERALRVVLVFPEESISRSCLPPENWAVCSEVYRGLITGAVQHGIQFSFEHMPENVSMSEQKEQLAKLHNYDAAVFIGEQLSFLQNEFAQNHPVFRVVALMPCRRPCPNVLLARMDKNETYGLLASHAAECRCNSAGVLLFQSSTYDTMSERAVDFFTSASRLGLKTSKSFIYQINCSDRSVMHAECDAIFRKALPDFLFCTNAEHIVDFYEAAFRNGKIPGRDFKIAGLASGLTLTGLIPSYTYVRVPYFETGMEIMARLRNSFDSKAMLLMHPELIVGKSTSDENIKFNHFIQNEREVLHV